ncbi:MAG: dephospho-CoA kinase [Gemmatimonadales bacterium]
MQSIALTGNIAAGKSTVAELFRRWGATIIDADQLVREAQRRGTPVLAAIAERFGADIIRSDGELDRAALRARVMHERAELAALNAIVHPEVRRRAAAHIEAARRAGAGIVVSDIPLLFETDDPARFDAVVLVDAPPALRRERLMRHRSLSAQEADGMMAAQDPAEEKRARSDYVIDNDGTIEDLERRARQVWEQLEAANERE